MKTLLERIADMAACVGGNVEEVLLDAAKEIENLRAKIEQMEKQATARLVTPTAYRWRYRGAIKWQYGELTEENARLAKEHNHEVQSLYTIPCAQGDEK